ncbi:PqqD family protein [Caldicellulosiruptor changbaiensis]|uniref:PqqD family protein n=1 Tax=Caldicellulosiruptor changbaiensis TaxID=1222016 RepID=A0A3T0D6R2_9FIRM|nr:PqqD family protein [Caldicellulosiruptor changbaiensis]AZT90767.1 PqqD family protein [Caldicellulosiruptor changbaiensis]
MPKYKQVKVDYRIFKNGYLFSNGIALNKTAFEIWECCREPVDENIIVKKFFEKYTPQSDEDKKMIIEDIKNCLNLLIEGNLIERIDE